MKKDTQGLRKRIACWLLAASAVLSTGCYVTEINADGSGTLTREVASPPGTDPQKFCPGAPKGYSATVEGTLCRATASFTNLSELRALLEAAQAPSVRINQLEKTSDGKLIVDLSVDTPDWLPEYVGQTYYWRLKLPGYIIRHSANQVSGNLLTWVVTSGQGVFRIEAESQLP
jgi:hypothetical protein